MNASEATMIELGLKTIDSETADLEPACGDAVAGPALGAAIRAVGAPDRAAGIRPGVAPFALLRVAGLPFQMLEDLRLPQTEACVETLLRAERTLAEQRQAVEDALFAAVPRIAADDGRCRRNVLSLRRDVHNERPTRLDVQALRTVRELLAHEPERAAFDAWVTAQHEHAQASQALEPGLRDEVQARLRPALRKPLQVATFRRGLAFASAGVERSARREKKLPTVEAPDNLERSLLGYLGRAAAKTSPFSSFMSLAVLELAPHDEAPFPCAAHAAHLNTVNLNRGMVSRLHQLSRTEAARADDLTLSLNSTLRPSANGRVHGLCNREIVLLGRPWWEQRWAQFRLDAELWSCLSERRTATWSTWHAELTTQGLDSAQAEQTLTKLIERGVLTVPELSDAFDAHPLRRLRGAWQRSRSLHLQALAPALDQVESLVAALPDAEGQDRIDALEQVRAAEQGLLGSLTAEPTESLHNLVLEDCWVNGIEGRAGAALLQPLGDLQRFLSGQVIVSPFYARLRAHFVAQFGAGGHCDDVVGFLLRVADKLVDIPEFGARQAELDSVPAAPGVRIPVTAHVQFAAAADGTPARVVVNRVFDGAGWLAARFTLGEQPGSRALRRQLTSWLQTLSGRREPVDVPVGGHCNDLQAHALLTPRVLHWPGEPVTLPTARVVEAAALRLVHDTATDLLEVEDNDGRALNLLYLGTTFPSPIWGLRYALSILTQPYLLARPQFPPPRANAADEVCFEPAMTEGALVLRRATWWLSAAYLQREWLAGSSAERLVRVRRDCARRGIPCTFFAQRYIAPERSSLIPSDVLNANRKPLWIDVRNPFWLAMLARMTEGGDWVLLTEALPAPDTLWLQLEGQAHVSEMQIEMLIEAGRPNDARMPGVFT